MSHRSLDPEASCPVEVSRLNRLLRTKGTTVEALAEAVAALSDAATHVHTVPLILRLSRHKSPAVRKGAVFAMMGHPLPAVGRRLSELEHDKDPGVRAQVKATEEAIEALPVLCANGCETPATLRAESNGDPYGPLDVEIYPIFCGDRCAVEWAMDRFREEAREGARHVCVVEMAWVAGAASECHDCEAADLLDEKTG